jgi:hypothetical protein
MEDLTGLALCSAGKKSKKAFCLVSGGQVRFAEGAQSGVVGLGLKPGHPRIIQSPASSKPLEVCSEFLDYAPVRGGVKATETTTPYLRLG